MGFITIPSLQYLTDNRHTVCLQEKEGKMVSIGPLQLAIHVVQNRHAGEQQSYWNMINKRHT